MRTEVLRNLSEVETFFSLCHKQYKIEIAECAKMKCSEVDSRYLV